MSAVEPEDELEPKLVAKVPYGFWPAADEAAARDREWFAAHPGIDMYVRPYIRDEAPEDPGYVEAYGLPCFVLVYQLAPAVRLRQPIYGSRHGMGKRPHVQTQEE